MALYFREGKGPFQTGAPCERDGWAPTRGSRRELRNSKNVGGLLLICWSLSLA